MDSKKLCKEKENDTEAKWIPSESGFNIHCSDNYHCSKCGNHEKFCTRFCSNCGRSMNTDKEEYWRTWL